MRLYEDRTSRLRVWGADLIEPGTLEQAAQTATLPAASLCVVEHELTALLNYKGTR